MALTPDERTPEEVLEAELVRLGARGYSAGGGRGAQWAAQRLKTDRFEATLDAGAPVDEVRAWVQAALAELGRPLDAPDLRAVIGAGFLNKNPAVVDVDLVALPGARTRVRVRAVAKEGLVARRAAAKAVGRVLDAVGAGRRRKGRRRDARRPAR